MSDIYKLNLTTLRDIRAGLDVSHVGDYIINDRPAPNWREIHQAITNGELYPERLLPHKAFGVYKDVKVRREIKARNFFNLGGFLGFSERLAELIQDFDYGGGGLHPIQIFEYDRETPVPGNFYILRFAGNKDTLIPEESKKLISEQPEGENPFWNAVIAKKGDLIVKSSAVGGADVWIDPKVTLDIFLSGRLVEAIKSVKPTGRLPLIECIVK